MMTVVIPNPKTEIDTKVLSDIKNLTDKSSKSQIEIGAHLCGITDENSLGNEIKKITSMGKVCFGDSCSIKIIDCDGQEQTGRFHTHPYNEAMSENELAYYGKPSWGDIYSALYGYYFWNSRVADCSIAIDKRGKHGKMFCYEVVKSPTKEVMDNFGQLYNTNRHKSALNKAELMQYVTPLSEVFVDYKPEPLIDPRTKDYLHQQQVAENRANWERWRRESRKK